MHTLENLKCVQIEKNTYESELNNDVNKYLYHFIVCEMKNGEILKVDNYNNLNLLNSNDILYKYYVEKIHYFKDKDNPHIEYGSTYYIHNIGYFYIGGLIENENISKEQINNMIEQYKEFYSKFSKEDDIEYLKKNM